jgi:hypothetical protein
MTLLDDLMAERPDASFDAELPPQKLRSSAPALVQIPRITSDQELSGSARSRRPLHREARPSAAAISARRAAMGPGVDLLPHHRARSAPSGLKKTSFWKMAKLARQLLGIELGNEIGGGAT